ncbi:GGDEF domain-containing protein [Ammoniphilus sp. YIM 78166]|uniref:GGDEF domain-containing protein n=1 Tax=Ammoniphilus sp. YIM 78166 TaxID=1644106 RepID=UPI00106FA8E3|nr:GGDEF domain-containing protein [Ammoniphilus sp. YIM 78166]
MQFKGRMISSLFVLFHTFYFLLFYDLSISEHPISFYLMTGSFTLFGWLLGFQYDKAMYFSAKDPLTRVYNRRFVTQRFAKLANHALKNNSTFCLFILDCNNFKTINDTYGHKMGDNVLSGLSKILKENTRRQDIVARWGGDEFVILACLHHPSAISSFQHRLDQNIAKLSLSMKVDISVSVGVSVSQGKMKSLQEMIHEADENLYSQKRLFRHGIKKEMAE